MGKTLIGVIVGIFIGAFAVEILRRKRPKTIKRIEERAAKAAGAVCQAFREGYSPPPQLDEQPD